ncbi:MAG: hypothetical protein PHW74_11610 [Desulfobacca sp.]|nr:hypothetical protein [Desulfobacca sp.]
MTDRMIPFQITFKVETLEEFHSGDGLARVGIYDSGQQAEYDDQGRRLPVIRNDTLSGLLRDCCAQLKDTPLYQKNFSTGELKELWDGLFNYGWGDSLMLSSLRPTPSSVAEFDKNGWPLFKLVSQTAIESGKRVAKEDSLRTIECGAAGLELGGEISGRAPKDKVEAAVQFLLDGLGNLKRLGGRRRRGFGALKIIEKQSNIVKDSPEKPEIIEKDLESKSTVISDIVEPVSLRLLLQTVEPVHVGASAQTANLMPCLDHIPGFTLLGAFRHEFRVELASRLESGPRQALGRLLDDFSPVSFGPAYPYPEGQGSKFFPEHLPQPVPLSWRRYKEQKHQAPGLDVLWEKDETEEKLKRFDNFYVCNQLIYRQPKIRIMRNQIDPVKGQVEEVGGLFTTEYLPAKTCLAAEIIFPTQTDYDLFHTAFGPWLTGERWLGLGHGRNPARIIDYRALSFLGRNEPPPDKFALHLISDMVSLTKALTFDTGLEEVIRDWPYQLDRTLARTRELHLYSPIGGLPGFPLVALEKGSTFLFQRKEDQDKKKVKEFWETLRQRELTGSLGEGQQHGWGRFRLAWQEEEKTLQGFQMAEENSPPSSALMPRREKLLEEARNFIICRNLHHKASDPARSQWGRLAALIEGSEESPKNILEQVEAKLQKNSVWKKTKFEGESLINLLIKELNNKTEQDQRLFINGLVRWLRVLKRD